MHPELYHVLHQQRERELEQRLARGLMRRESAAAPATRDAPAPSWPRRAATAWLVAATAARGRLGLLRTAPVGVECCAAA